MMQFKALNGLGKIILGIGAFIGLGTLLMYLLQVIGKILSAAFGLAWKIAIVVIVILVVYAIIKTLYDWITGNNK
jgi:hypothetical protein